MTEEEKYECMMQYMISWIKRDFTGDKQIEMLDGVRKHFKERGANLIGIFAADRTEYITHLLQHVKRD